MVKRKAVIAAVKSWNLAAAEALRQKFCADWDITVLSGREQLSFESLSTLRPEFIFFPHWSWMIPEEIYSQFDCIVFHMTDLPFGRGGSPLQNLILRKIERTKISALKACKGADTGPVYFKRDLDISTGSADEILRRASAVIFDEMIPEFLDGRTAAPKPQEGEPVEFVRRKPQESDLSGAEIKTQRDLFDFIRMLDGEGYPRAFLRLGEARIEFREARLTDGGFTGVFEVKRNERK